MCKTCLQTHRAGPQGYSFPFCHSSPHFCPLLRRAFSEFIPFLTITPSQDQLRFTCVMLSDHHASLYTLAFITIICMITCLRVCKLLEGRNHVCLFPFCILAHGNHLVFKYLLGEWNYEWYKRNFSSPSISKFDLQI